MISPPEAPEPSAEPPPPPSVRLHASSVYSAATADALELPALLAVVAELAATDLGRERLLSLVPETDPRTLAGHRRRFEEAARLVGERRLVGGFDVPVGELVERLETGRPPLAGADLVRLAALVREVRDAAGRIAAADPPCPALAEAVEGLPDLSDFARRVGGALDRRGEVREDASPTLVELRRRIRTSRDRLYSDLSDFVGRHRSELSEETVPMRGGRLVVVLQAGSRGRVPGLTHGRSGSGKSFYFEPLEVVEGNNVLQQAVEDEEAERQRILAELLAVARAELPAFERHAEVLGELDRLQASVRFADACGGRLVETSGSGGAAGAPGELRLVGARHPLLVPELASLRAAALGHAGHRGEVVPLDVELEPERRILVVTGPNAGGKTVALKTVGLLALAAQAGLPVPVEAGSRLPLFERVVATVGDEQDLLADRSTFSGRLLRLREAWEEASPATLVLLDELGSGTDPEEGSALAVALLEELLEQGALGIITTHLTQLAAAALELPGAACAAMEFGAATGEPTYRLLPGPPGGSEAIALGRRLGLPERWLTRAEERLGTEHRELRRLLGEVETLRDELASARGAAEAEARRLEELTEAVERKRDELETERRSLAKRLRAELESFRVETRRRLAEEVERLEEELAAGRRKRLAAEATERLFEAAPELPEPEPAATGPLVVGEPVRHAGLGWQGRLESLDRGRAVVRVRGKRVRCKAEELAPASEAKAASGRGGRARQEDVGGRRSSGGSVRRASSGHAGGRRGGRGDHETAGVEVAAELMLVGQRVEPALSRLDDYLDRALLGSRPEVRIVHGHGSGRLRQAVREHLRRHRAVAAHRPGAPDEGGDGATVVTLRGA